MKKLNKVFIYTFLMIALLSTTVMANRSSFSLGPNNTYVNTKDNPWYYDTGVIDVGVKNFKGGTGSIEFKEVRRFSPDMVKASFYLDSDNSSYYQRTINVSDKNAYYYIVNRNSGYPKGTVFAE
ncbi:MAG: hypothetical protein E7L45_03835 [Peptoniphilus lacydonensis]|uniref:hypothetical protein n=1 Tax=Peptoniphilus lacydonensis TaxID=1673725 RepID=UPI00259105CA|nr:hypothetical protein [Peptoniphilus lacydonensis]MDU7302427.1 hypothetical protein [Peptoniphilus lacydonensis]